MVNRADDKPARAMTWVSSGFEGWTCSRCEWNYPLPTLLNDPEARTAYDRLASANFRKHVCESYLSRLKSGEPASFAERMHEPKILEQVRKEGEDFLRRIRLGLI